MKNKKRNPRIFFLHVTGKRKKTGKTKYKQKWKNVCEPEKVYLCGGDFEASSRIELRFDDLERSFRSNQKGRNM